MIPLQTNLAAQYFYLLEFGSLSSILEADVLSLNVIQCNVFYFNCIMIQILSIYNAELYRYRYHESEGSYLL